MCVPAPGPTRERALTRHDYAKEDTAAMFNRLHTLTFSPRATLFCALVTLVVAVLAVVLVSV